MALSSSVYWEIQGGVGDDTNGGGFNASASGATKSITDNLTYGTSSAITSFTDLACVTASTTLTSATGGFTADMVGHTINIASGTNFTAGFYEITAYTDTNTVTIDVTACDGVGDGVSGAGKVGGALNTITKATAASVAGNAYFVKYATYTETVTLVASRTLHGYKTTRYDYPKGDDRPLIDGESTRAYGINFGNADGVNVSNFRVTGCTSYGLCLIKTTVFNCKAFANATGAQNGYGRTTYHYFCEYSGNTSAGFYRSGSPTTYFYDCYIDSNGSTGVETRYGEGRNTIFSNNSGFGIYFNLSGGKLYGCTLYDNGGDGVNWNGSAGNVWNTTSSDNTGDGFDADGCWGIFAYNQADGNGATDITSGITTSLLYQSATIQTGDPKLNDPENGDFTLQTGSACLNNGCDVGTWTGATT